MFKRKLKYFFVTLIVSLLIILPTFILIGAYSISNVLLVGQSVDDVPTTRPTDEDKKSVLLIKDSEAPSFTLFRFDAFGGKVVSLTFPSDLLLGSTDNAKEILELGGPAMVTTELETLLEITIDYYIMMSEYQLMEMTGSFKAATPSPTIAERIPMLEGVSISTTTMAELIEENPNDDLLRTVCYSLLLEGNMNIMASEISTAFLDMSDEINTNIGAEALHRMTKIFSLLPYENVNYYAATLSGEETSHGISINTDDLEKAQELMG